MLTNLTLDKMKDENQIELNKVIPLLKAAFTEYLKTKDVVQLRVSLESIDKQARKLSKDRKKENGLWWRFFRNDTGANTSWSILHCLEDKGIGNVNIKYYEECMQISLEPDTEMIVYFS